jgi:hypothetical protein
MLTGCQDKLEIEGKVFENNTSITIPHRKIIVQALINNNKKVIPVYADEFFTDSSGHFNYTLRKLSNVYLYNFSIVGDSTYAFSNNRLGLSELKRDGRFLSFYLNKLADFTIAIERKTKTTSNDTLYVSWESDGIDGKLLYPYTIKHYNINNGRTSSDLEFRWIGGDIESAIKTKVFADKETIVHWELYRNGERRKITDTIICIRDVSNYTYFKY